MLIEVGEWFFVNLMFYYDGIEIEFVILGELCEKLGGMICISFYDYLVIIILWLKFLKLLKEYFDIMFEINVDYGLIDIVVGCFDVGVCIGD